MAGRGLFQIIDDIVNSSKKPLTGKDLRAATKAIQSQAGPISQLPKAGEKMLIPSIRQIKKDLLDTQLNSSGSGGYGAIGLSRPVEAYSPRNVTSNTPLNAEKRMSLEDIELQYITPTYWDRSDAGNTLTGVGKMDLQRGYEQGGGIGFMRGPSAQADNSVAASELGVVSRYNNMAQELAQDGKTLNLVPISMIPDALDFQAITSRVAADLLQQSKIKKSVISDFDEAIKARDKTWPGLLSENLDTYIQTASPDQRKAFIRFVDSKAAQKMGIPTDAAAAARYSVTDPAQRTLPPGFGGMGIARISPSSDAIVQNPKVPHPDFSTQIRGDYLGKLDVPMHQSLLFPKTWGSFDGQLDKNGFPLTDANKTYGLKTKAPIEQVTREMVDNYMTNLELAKARGLLDF
tara:strand:- start:497 stop:1708 length:1212 start_codon:yes stop_codon:yes gene_type:complete